MEYKYKYSIMNEESKTPDEKLKDAKIMFKKKQDKLQYIKQRIASAKRAKNKQRIKIAELDYDICSLDIEKYKIKINKYKIQSE